MSDLAALNAESSSGVALTAATSTPLLSYNNDRNGLSITADSANTTPVLLLLYSQSAAPPTASATAYHILIPAGGRWDGNIGMGDEVVNWQGGVVAFSTAAARVSIASA